MGSWGRKERNPKLITVQGNQMYSQRNKFHCCIRSKRNEKPGKGTDEAVQKSRRLEYGLESALISLLQFYLIALIRNYVYAMLRQALEHRAKLSSALSAGGIRPAKRR